MWHAQRTRSGLQSEQVLSASICPSRSICPLPTEEHMAGRGCPLQLEPIIRHRRQICPQTTHKPAAKRRTSPEDTETCESGNKCLLLNVTEILWWFLMQHHYEKKLTDTFFCYSTLTYKVWERSYLNMLQKITTSVMFVFLKIVFPIRTRKLSAFQCSLTVRDKFEMFFYFCFLMWRNI